TPGTPTASNNLDAFHRQTLINSSSIVSHSSATRSRTTSPRPRSPPSKNGAGRLLFSTNEFSDDEHESSPLHHSSSASPGLYQEPIMTINIHTRDHNSRRASKYRYSDEEDEDEAPLLLHSSSSFTSHSSSTQRGVRGHSGAGTGSGSGNSGGGSATAAALGGGVAGQRT
ncbi:hypothetical protein BGZ73_008840, partial [Actinomortierella ambigua]